MPVMAAFNHCRGENLHTEEQIMTISTAFQSNQKAISTPLEKQLNHKMQHCHASAQCSFHLCYAKYFSGIDKFHFISSTPLYSYSQNSLLSSFSHSPELRPPIS